MEQEIEKLKYQMSLLVNMIDSDKYPIESLLFQFNWNDEDLNNVHDIFEKYNKKIEAKETDINWNTFEHELRDKFTIGYQEVKLIINALYQNNQWQGVCYYYAKAHQSIEFNYLIKDFKKYL